MPQGTPDVKSVIAQIVTVQESFRQALEGLTRLVLTSGADAQRLSSAIGDIASMQRRMLEAQQQSDERLNALIAVVDDLVRNGEVKLPSD